MDAPTPVLKAFFRPAYSFRALSFRILKFPLFPSPSARSASGPKGGSQGPFGPLGPWALGGDKARFARYHGTPEALYEPR